MNIARTRESFIYINALLNKTHSVGAALIYIIQQAWERRASPNPNRLTQKGTQASSQQKKRRYTKDSLKLTLFQKRKPRVGRKNIFPANLLWWIKRRFKLLINLRISWPLQLLSTAFYAPLLNFPARLLFSKTHSPERQLKKDECKRSLFRDTPACEESAQHNEMMLRAWDEGKRALHCVFCWPYLRASTLERLLIYICTRAASSIKLCSCCDVMCEGGEGDQNWKLI